MDNWAKDAIFYHIYPLGLCGAPNHNDFNSPPRPRLDAILAWIGHIRALGMNALYLGPVFESTSHGYDTADYWRVDRRLGTNETLGYLTQQLHQAGVRVVLDGVFNHVGRDFWAFRDLQVHGEESPYRRWFAGVDFSRRSPYGDMFSYEGWSGHYNLVKLNLHHHDVRAHLFSAVRMWIEVLGIDGLRLDAADVMDRGFLADLAHFCRSLRPDFWLVGEVIHGDYRQWANPQTLDATTNYECYKGLYSSHNDNNFFEIAYTLNRQFGPHGIYRELPLYNFADNHDVNRIASTLRNGAHLYPLYALLMTIPAVPSIYYGSEWGIAGVKHNGDDRPLRPALELSTAASNAPHADLAQAISRFAQIRHERPALRSGGYKQLAVGPSHLAFARWTDEEYLAVVVNAADTPQRLEITVDVADGTMFGDLLDPQACFTVNSGRVQIEEVPACWARILYVIEKGA